MNNSECVGLPRCGTILKFPNDIDNKKNTGMKVMRFKTQWDEKVYWCF